MSQNYLLSNHFFELSTIFLIAYPIATINNPIIPPSIGNGGGGGGMPCAKAAFAIKTKAKNNIALKYLFAIQFYSIRFL